MFRVLSTIFSSLIILAISWADTQYVPGPTDIHPAIIGLKPSRPTNPSTMLHLCISLQPTDMQGMQDFADSVSNPKSPNYGRFLTPEDVGSRFGPTELQVADTVAFLKQNGMIITLVSRNRLGILAEATVAQCNSAFHTQIMDYRAQNPLGIDMITFHANATQAQIPASLNGIVVGIEGLENYTRPMPRTTLLNPTLTRTLYDTVTSWNSGYTGLGRTIGISNWDGYRLTNVPLYYSHFSLPTPAGGVGTNVTEVKIGGGSGSGSPGGEGDLDIQMELGMAPLCHMIIYDGTALQSSLTKEASDDLCDCLSESYGWQLSGGAATNAHTTHVAMSAQGITYMAASGDSGTSLEPYSYPDYEPEVLQVGGTVANVNGSGTRVTEVGWGGSGGGWSTNGASFNKRPSWQTGNGVPTIANSADKRLVPDVGIHAAGNGTGAYQFYFGGGLNGGSIGTSFASPVFAGALAITEQELIAAGGLPANGKGKQRFGRIQDLFYSMNGDPSVWHDITSGANGNLPNGQASKCAAGWDPVTGWGAPDFHALAVSQAGGGSNPVATKMTETNLSGTFGQVVTQSATLVTSDNSTPVVGRTINFTANGVASSSGTTNSSGVATANFTIPESLGVGTFPLTAAWVGDLSFLTSNATATITVSKGNSNITTAPASGAYGTTVTLTATLTRAIDNGRLSSRTVSFSVDGVQVGTKATTSLGVANFSYKVSADFTPGSHVLAADWAGDALYNAPSTATSTLTIAKADTTIGNVNSPSATYGQTVTLSAVLTRSTDALGLDGKTIAISVNGDQIASPVTSGGGAAAFGYKVPDDLPLGSNSLSLSFAGDTYYNASNANATLTVIKGNTLVVGQNAAGLPGANVDLVAAMTRTSDNAPTVGRSVTFSVDGASVGSAQTNANGVATFTYAISAGATLGGHSLQAAFAGDGQYNPSADNSKMLTVMSGSGTTVSGTVALQFVTNPLGQTATLDFRIPGTSTVVYSAPIILDASGGYSLNGVPMGTYDMSVKFPSWLRQTLANVAVLAPATANFSALCGDAVQDNKIDLFDASNVLTDFGGTAGDPADVDWSGAVDLFDLNIILQNFGMVGDN